MSELCNKPSEGLTESHIKVYAFKCGSIKTLTQLVIKDTRVGTPFNIPVPFYLVKHGNEWVAFDTGMNAQVINNPTAYLGADRAKNFTPIMSPEDEFEIQIRRLGLQPKDISALVLSHGHFDHSGGLGSFRGTNVPIYIQKNELTGIKQVVNDKKSGAYVLGDFKYFTELSFKEIEGVYDVFGDKTVVVFPTPGHTMGHQSLYVKSSKGKPLILTADSLYTMENMEKMIPSNSAADFSLLMQGLAMFKLLSITGVEIVPSHDPGYWERVSLAPDELIIN